MTNSKARIGERIPNKSIPETTCALFCLRVICVRHSLVIMVSFFVIPFRSQARQMAAGLPLDSIEKSSHRSYSASLPVSLIRFSTSLMVLDLFKSWEATKIGFFCAAAMARQSLGARSTSTIFRAGSFCCSQNQPREVGGILQIRDDDAFDVDAEALEIRLMRS